MLSIVITIRRRGVPARRVVGIWPSTTDAVLAGIDMAGNEGGPASVRAEVLA